MTLTDIEPKFRMSFLKFLDAPKSIEILVIDGIDEQDCLTTLKTIPDHATYITLNSLDLVSMISVGMLHKIERLSNI